MGQTIHAQLVTRCDSMSDPAGPNEVMPEAISREPETPVRKIAVWKVILLLFVLSVLGSLLVVPFSWSLSEQMPLPQTPVPREVFLLIVHVVQVGIEGLL